MYLLVTNKVVSSTLIQKEGKHQLPIYFTKCVLHDADKRYQMIEKVALAFITLVWRLKPYFQSHQVVVKTNYPIKQVLGKPELARRMVPWSVELLDFDLQYEPCCPMKTQFMKTLWQSLLETTKSPQTSGASTLVVRPTWRGTEQESSSKALTMSL